MSCLGGILGWFWSFVKNFFEGHTSPPPRSAFAPPVPLCNEPGCFDRFTNLLCVNLLQHWYTCFCVATSVKISVFGVHFWRGGFVYILRKWIFIFTAFMFFLPCLILSYFAPFPFVLIRFYRWFVLFVLLYFVPIVSRGGVVSLLTRWLTCHVNELPRYHVIKLPYYLRLRFEVSKTCHIICAWRFATLFVLCVPSGGVVLSCFAVAAFAVVGVFSLRPSTTPAACR